MSTSIDFDVVPAKAKCDKCSQEEEIPVEKSLKALTKFMEAFNAKHKDCV